MCLFYIFACTKNNINFNNKNKQKMKGNKMKWLGTIMGFFFLLLNSCESEEHMLENHNKEVEYIEKVTYNEFIQNLKSHKITTSQYLQAIFFEDPTNKSAKTNQFNIIVDKENVTKINAANALVTYNFNVTTNDPDPRDHFYKLLLIMQHGKYDLKLLKFLPNEISEQALKKDSPFKGTIQNMPLAYNPLVNRDCYGSSVLVTEFMPCVNHGFYSPQSNPYCAGGHYETRVETLTTCDVYDNGNGNGGGGGGTQNDDPNWVGTANNNAENSLVPSNYVGIYPIDFTPFYDGLIKYNNFKYQELTDEQLTYLNNHDDVNIAIKNYLIQNTDNSGNFTNEAKEFAKQLINFAMENHITFTLNNLDPKNFKSFNNFQELQSFLDSENIDLQNNTETNDVTDIGSDKKISRRKIGLTPTHDLAVELVFTPMPNFELDNSQSTVELSSMITLSAYSWTQKSLFVNNENWTATDAQITITGYILYGIKVGDFEFGIKKLKEIKLAMDKKNGKICCTWVKNIE